MSTQKRKRKIYYRQGVRTRITYRQIIAATSGVFAMVAIGAFFYFGGKSEEARAATSGDYRTVASGSWSTASIWQYYNGTSWVTPGSAPTASNNIIEIQANHTVMISSSVTVDQLIIDAGGTLTVTSNTLTISNTTGTDVQIDGTLNVFGTLTLSSNSRVDVNSSLVLKTGCTVNRNSGSGIYVYGRAKVEGGTVPTVASFWYVQTGGFYEHAFNGGAFPLATWSTGSTLEVTGITNTLPSNLTQSFQNFIWNNSGQLVELNCVAALTTVLGDFTMANTGIGALNFDQQGNNNTLNISGNYIGTGGTLYMCINGSSTMNVAGNLTMTGGYLALNEAGGVAYGNSSAILNVNKNVVVTGGTIDMSQCTANNPAKGLGFINVKGNLNVTTPGVITETSSASRGMVTFNGTTANQTTNDLTNITNSVDITVASGAVLQMDNKVLSSDADFTLAAGAGIQIGSAAGITQTSLSGNIQSKGTRSYNTGADYTYNGLTAQVSGDGLPSQVRNLTLNNSMNCVLTNSTSVDKTLTFTSGLWIASNDTLTLGTSTSSLGTLSRVSGHVVGSFRRWLSNTAASNVLFPVGTLSYYNGANFSFTTAPTFGGTITSNFIANGYVGTSGLPLVDAGDNCVNVGYAYWLLGSANGFTGGAWSVNLYANGFPAILDYTKLHVFRRANSSSNWLVNGTHSAGTGSNSAPVGNRTGMTILGQYGIVSGSANPLPIELVFFKAKAVSSSVDLTWQTATEINNDYFTVERSKDGVQFSSVGNVQGAGNTTVTKNYKFTDYAPLKGISFYRLRQTDFDGKTTTSEIQKISIGDDGMDHPVSIETVRPNPFTNEFTATYFSDHDGDVSIEIYDMQGKLVYKGYQQSINGRNEFNYTEGSALPNGQYILRIAHSGGVASSKIIKR